MMKRHAFRHDRVFPAFLLALPALPAALWMLVFVGVVVAPAGGQETSGLLPDPITSADLSGYADRLVLSDEQRRAIGRFHDQYFERFRELRDGEIDTFLDSMRGMGRRVPERAVVERRVRDLNRINARIRALDESFLAEVRVLLTDRQQRELPRIQMARERKRLTRGNTALPRDARSLAAVLREMNLSRQERESIDGLLLDYETRLTRQFRRIQEAEMESRLGMYDAMEDLGFGPGSFRGAESSEERRALADAWSDAVQVVRSELAGDYQALREIHLRAYRAIAPVLEVKNRRAFRAEFLRLAYADLNRITREPLFERIDLALSLEVIDEDERERLEAARIELGERKAQLHREIVALGPTHPRDRTMRPDSHQEGLQVYREQRDALRERYRALTADAGKRFDEIISTQQQERIALADLEQQARWAREAFGDVSRVAPGRQWDALAGTSRRSGDRYVPGRMTRRTVTIFADELGLDQAGRAQLESVFQAYREGHEQRVEPIVQQIRSDRRAISQRDVEAGGRIFERRRAAQAELVALDQALFASLREKLGK